MEAEVVGYGDTLELAKDFKSSVNAAKALKGLLDSLSGNTHIVGSCGSGYGVEHIVEARNDEINSAYVLALVHEGKALTGGSGLVQLSRVVVILV